MLRHSLRVRLLLPVLALVLVVVAALTIILAITEANRVRANAGRVIDGQTVALQSLFAVTRSVMLDRVHGSMRLLRHEAERVGTTSVGPQIRIDGRLTNDLFFGGVPQANNYTLVDSVTSIAEGTATIFSRAGDDFVRIATNVKKDDGSRAVGTVLDPQGQAIAQIRKAQSFYGVVDILGNPYVTGYEPIFTGMDDQHPVGIWYVGYKTDLQALNQVVSDSHVLESGFIAVFDAKDKLRFQSKTGATIDPKEVERVVREMPQDWVVTQQEVPGWGFNLVAAYPKSDVNRVILRQSLWIGGIGLMVCALLLGLQWSLIMNRVLRPIQRLTAVAEELSVGKWNHTIVEADLKDEIGKLARAISRLSYSVRVAMERLSKQR
ncbi:MULTISPECIES: Cache 3/Cache 2 fusion domain-containing protein [unclassified Lysobacter]|uniref:Cache 3/Cache 2 fusion domain-containing protein n=1 Tax=unclassified Lysobacter TaxID=2635362 RepID=UPI001BE6710C|nr:MULTISPECIES: Cache 3/Cache 2 fusion domain-containing protein [unclassified Lysobacter]MBT2746708.1 Cache 3/Cache 2 fusion domain-containing protein [Lysobacter sp. ISL-42]MBT2751757.1 Cache 3/Cache 2 fusion domain-containing protein [Lysobacter sp. ISL-50]MBT2778109.1 Cache 3/Cache 2 fusion domain-containing protein [Lysobacter sp. ISL-54]MBT2781750.1 Cache 3/Cache 2 fusion domain-containing protein [Lysobacter sp. ISL-52]